MNYELTDESDEHGNFLRYHLVFEFSHKPPLPTPFSILYYIYEILVKVYWCCCRCGKQPHETDAKIPLGMKILFN